MLDLRLLLVHKESMLKKAKVKTNSQCCFEIRKVNSAYHIEPTRNIGKWHIQLDNWL
jgi:hypothetical protein